MGEVRIVDEMMGAGKTSAAINYINRSSNEKKFIVITPYLSEVERFQNSCPKRKFKDPQPYNGTKIVGIKKLIKDNENIVSTHALFSKFDEEIVGMINRRKYTLILDEAATVIEEINISDKDLSILLEKFITVDPVTGIVYWSEDEMDYKGKFSDMKELCELQRLACYENCKLLWIFPVDTFRAFKEVYVLTYMFHAQVQRYYFDFYGVHYAYWHVKGDNPDNYEFCKEKDNKKSKYNYKELIHICNTNRLNDIGKENYSLSKMWYEKNGAGSAAMERLKKNIYNFFTNVCKGSSPENLWTTFLSAKNSLKGKRYGSDDCFLSMNARATNEKRDRHNVAYTVNRYLHPIIKQFFKKKGVVVDEDGFALSEMIQFIWRSSIRDGKEINVYIPSKRMRKLLVKWIEKVSVEGE